MTVLLRERLLVGLWTGSLEILALRFIDEGLIGVTSAGALTGTLDTVWKTLSDSTRFGVANI